MLIENWNSKSTGEKINYPNKLITHMNATFNATPSGIFNRIERINSSTEKKAQMRIDEKYHGNTNA